VRVLLVDDDPKLRDTIQRGLDAAGMHCVATGDFESAIELLRPEHDFDLAVLDVMMPGKSGWDLLTELRDRGDAIPVLFATGRRTVEDRVHGLNLGADDYLTKPFAFDELTARILAVVRRRRELPTLSWGDLRLDLARRSTYVATQHIELSPREFDLLLALTEARGEVCSREQLLRAAWGIEIHPGTNVVDVHIAGLRRRLRRPGIIETVVGKGYRLADLPRTT